VLAQQPGHERLPQLGAEISQLGEQCDGILA
jgi:hypothetical protein